MNALDFGFGSIEAQLWQILFLSVRCGAALMAAPMVGGMAVPAPVRILLSLTLGYFIAAWVPLAPAPEMLSLAAVLALLHEIAVGLMLGFVLQLAFAIPLIAAEQISGTMGLAIATSIDPTEVKNAVTAYLTRNPDTQALFILGSDPAMPAVEAVEGMGLLGKVKLATFDLSEGILKAVRDGKMEFAIDQQQYLQGYLPVVLLRLYKKFGLMPGADVLTGPGLVTKANAASVIDWSAKGYR